MKNKKRSSPKCSPIYGRNESERQLNKERSLRQDLIQFLAELNAGVEPTTISAKQEQTRGSESGRRNFFFYHGFADLLRHIRVPTLSFVLRSQF